MSERCGAWGSRPDDLETDGQLIAWALTQVAEAINQHWYEMGLRDAATPMGAMELLSKEIRTLANAVDAIATAIANG